MAPATLLLPATPRAAEPPAEVSALAGLAPKAEALARAALEAKERPRDGAERVLYQLD